MILKPLLLTEVIDAEAKDNGTVLEDKTPVRTDENVFPNEPIYGTERNDTRLVGTDEDDLIFALGGKDIVHGGDGDDTIFGGDDGDRITGGDGSDVINGGRGNDVLAGDFFGWGQDHEPETMNADFFVFDVAHWGNDTIMDFDKNLDKIVFTAASGVTDISDLTIQQLLHQSTGDVYTKITFDDGIGESSIRLFNFDEVFDPADIII